MLVVVSNDLLGLMSFLLPVFSFIIWKIFNRFEKAIYLSVILVLIWMLYVGNMLLFGFNIQSY